MGEALALVLPAALAVALSPFPVVPVVLLLLTPRARVTAGSFLLGWVLGVGGAAAAFALLASVVERGETPTWASWLRLVIGLALVALGVRKWGRRSAASKPPGWMASLSEAGPGKALRLALLLSLANPKVLLLSAAAGLTIGGTDVTTGQSVAVVAAFTAVASLTVALPVVLHLVLGRRMVGALNRTKDWLLAHNVALIAVVAIAIGLLQISKGLAELF